MADQAFPAEPAAATLAKIGVLIGSVLSAALGACDHPFEPARRGAHRSVKGSCVQVDATKLPIGHLL